MAQMFFVMPNKSTGTRSGVFEIIQHLDITKQGSVANTDSTP